MSAARPTRLPRRGLPAAGGARGVGAALSACGGGSDGGGSHRDGESRSFTAGRKEKTTASGVPERMVAFTGTAAVLHTPRAHADPHPAPAPLPK